MTGGIKGVSFYSLKGSDKVFMRTKGGPTKDQLANSPKYSEVRKQQKEFGGCAKFGSLARYSFGGLHRLADYNMTPVLNGIGKNLMKLDTTSEKGRRKLKLTAHKQALEGFNFNHNFPFGSVQRVQCSALLELKHSTIGIMIHSTIQLNQSLSFYLFTIMLTLRV